MKTIAVTIGIGKLHEQMAKWAAVRVQHYLKLETRTIGESYLNYALPGLSIPENLYSIKFSLFDIFPDADRIMYFDCDWRPVRAFNLDDYCPDPTQFYAVPDRGEWAEVVANLARSYNLKPTEYFNAGWFVAHRQHQPLFQKCKDTYFQLPKVFQDQCVLNQVFKDHVKLLPRKINTMDFNAVPAREILGFHNGISIFIAAKKILDYDWDAAPQEIPAAIAKQCEDYNKLKLLNYAHEAITDYSHLVDIYQCAKDYSGRNALEVGSFKGHGALALRLAGLNVRSCDLSYTHMAERKFVCPGAAFVISTGEDELKTPWKYYVIFHNAYHGEQVVQELFWYWEEKLFPGGLLIVHDTAAFNLANFLDKIGQPMYKNTFDSRGRGLGFFWKPTQ